MNSIPVITVDGASGVGKGTVCALLAAQLNWHFLDSGAIYRLTALYALDHQLDVTDEKVLLASLDDLSIRFENQHVYLNERVVTDAIREESVGQAASKVAVHPGLRDALLQYQRNFRMTPGLIADGRDMGTVVFPDAELKVFLSASVDARAQRRFKQLNDKGKNVSLCAVLTELNARDARDQSRKVAPLEPAKDAVVIDTTSLDAQSVFSQVMTLAIARGIAPS